jgi:hypothetical protein
MEVGNCVRHLVATKSIPSGARYVICTVELDEENPTYASLGQENGFGSA